ncbi:MAG: chorismate-binding protein [Bacteroidota bacterium]
MRQKLLEEIDILVGDLNHLFTQLITHQFSFAIWRLPDSKTSYLLIDLGTQSGNNRSSIEELSECFILNPFNKNHPPHPLILSGDVIIKFSDEKHETNISPRMSANDIEKLLGISQSVYDKRTPKSQKPITKSHDFIQKVEKAIAEIRNGNAHKIVLSRFEEFSLSETFSFKECFELLKSNYPNAFCYLTHTTDYGTWMGASPENLISIENDRIFKTESLAGTQYLPEIDNLGDVAWTQKEIEEQAMVSRYIIGCLKKIRLREFEESGPKTVRAGKLVHLKTEYKVDMVETNTPELGSVMLELLHPTSAVCGSPFEQADKFIKENEGYDRALYSGFLGPVNFDKSTHLFVNLRCMQILGDKARLFAGAGITEDSNPEKEYLETVNKMKTLADLL